MTVYLHDIPLPEAQARLQAALEKAGLWGVLATETIPLDENAVGRVLAGPVWAKISYPHYHASAMDGFAVRSEATIGALPNQPVVLFCIETVESARTVYLDTGDPLPVWADAVIPIEDVEPLDEGGKPAEAARRPHAIRLRASITPWSHVRPLGEDIVASQLVLPAGQRLRPVDLGAIAASGHHQLVVSRKPRVSILPTGTELIPVGMSVMAGKIIEFNSLTIEIFIEPLLARWLGCQPRQPVIVNATLTRKLTSPAGDDDYTRMAVGYVGDRLLAAPLVRGSGVITSLVRADGITIIPSGSQGLSAGAEVAIRLYCSPNDLRRAFFATGSHDMTLDLITQFLTEYDRRLISANVGSQGGLAALRRGEAHLAGSHLLDPKTGIYNLAAIREYLPDTPVKVVALVDRKQGPMVRRGNPKCIQIIEHLSNPDVTFINRQRGAGTRVLLDYHLERLGIAPQTIQGYNQEEFTHLAVTAAIASGRADCGLGIAAAAEALDLDFIPLYDENYELIIPTRFFENPLLKPLFDILHSEKFRKAVEAMPGYSVSRMGTLVHEVS